MELDKAKAKLSWNLLSNVFLETIHLSLKAIKRQIKFLLKKNGPEQEENLKNTSPQ